MLNYNTLFFFALIFGALIAIGGHIAILAINAIKEIGMIYIYKVSVAYTENGALKMCEVCVTFPNEVEPLKKMVFIDSIIREYLEVKLKVRNSEPVIVGMNYFGKMKLKEIVKKYKEVVVVDKGID